MDEFTELTSEQHTFNSKNLVTGLKIKLEFLKNKMNSYCSSKKFNRVSAFSCTVYHYFRMFCAFYHADGTLKSRPFN